MADSVLYQRATLARFSGHCPICEAAIIRKHDRIVHVDGRGFVHVECAEAEGLEIVEPDAPAPWRKPDWWEDT